MRTDRQKETTTHPFLWEIQLKILYSQSWWYLVLVPAMWYAAVFWGCKKWQATQRLSIRGCSSAGWWSPGFPWALWTSAEPREVVYRHSGCRETLRAILTVRHQSSHCTVSQVNSEAHKRQKKGTFMSALKRCWRFGSPEEGGKKLRKTLILLGVRIKREMEESTLVRW